MTAPYVLSPRAQSDIDKIWDYTITQWGIDQAESYTRELQRNIEAIAAQPNKGRSCPEVRSGYFKIPSGSHVVFYRMTGQRVEVVRVLHSRMDFERHISREK